MILNLYYIQGMQTTFNELKLKLISFSFFSDGFWARIRHQNAGIFSSSWRGILAKKKTLNCISSVACRFIIYSVKQNLFIVLEKALAALFPLKKFRINFLSLHSFQLTTDHRNFQFAIFVKAHQAHLVSAIIFPTEYKVKFMNELRTHLFAEDSLSWYTGIDYPLNKIENIVYLVLVSTIVLKNMHYY